MKMSPESGSLLTLGEKGHYAQHGGEVMHLIKCPPVQALLRSATDCSLEIPVTINKENVYLTPHTRIIVRSPNVVDCSTITPPTFHIMGEWLAMTPSWIMVKSPLILTPNKQLPVVFRNIMSFSAGGIYSPEQLTQMREFMTYGQRRSAIVTNMVRGLDYKSINEQYNMMNLMSESGWKQIAKKMWGVFQAIGNILTGLFGFYFCGSLIFCTMNMVGRCCLNYQKGGCGWGLLAAVSSTLTLWFHYFVKLGQSNTSDPSHTGTTDVIPNTIEDIIVNAPAAEAGNDGYNQPYQPAARLLDHSRVMAP